MNLDVARAAEIIHEQFPELAPACVTYLGEGYDSAAFDVNDTWVFRFPKRPDVEQQLLIEMQVLPLLTTKAPVPIPAFCFRGRPSSGFPRHFGGYPRLPGVPAIDLDQAHIPVRLAPTLGRFLSWLHAFPAADVERLGVPHQAIEDVLDEVRSEALADFELVNRVAPDAPLEKWHAYLEAAEVDARGALVALTHNDLAAEHVLLDPGTRDITGIIDWSDIAIADRAADFAGIFHWGGDPLVKAVLSAYRGAVDVGLLRRARFMAACRGVGDVVFGLEMARREYVDFGIRALKICIP
jgi:aminoglycoside phosphotransferase (APT) family kinase protein